MTQAYHFFSSRMKSSLWYNPAMAQSKITYALDRDRDAAQSDPSMDLSESRYHEMGQTEECARKGMPAEDHSEPDLEEFRNDRP